MLSNPVQTIGVTLREFWHLVVSPTEWDPEARIWSVLFWLGLLGMAVRARQPETRLLMLLTISQLMLYPLLTVCDGRYRIPLEPVFLVFVVVAAYEIGRVASQPEQEITV
jgi:hypothetical protein